MDSLLAIELGKPMLINDDECDTEYPEILDEERSQAESSTSGADPPPWTILLATIHITRLMAPIARLFRSLCITNETLLKFDGHLGTCLALFPPSLSVHSTSPIDPRNMMPLIYFQNSRLMLYRHNLSPSCSPEQRSSAVRHCVAAAHDTSKIIMRCLTIDGRPHAEAEQHLVMSATTLLCTHIWRAMLFLLFRPLDDSFFALLRAASSIGTSKAVNISCGRYLSFCLRKLCEIMESPMAIDLEQDEEIIAYLSGDLQAGTNSWIWGNVETGTHLSRRQKHGRPKQSSQDHDAMPSGIAQAPSWDSVLSSEEQQDWGGWQTVERGARYLQSLQEKRMEGNAPASTYAIADRPVSILPRVGLTDSQPGPAMHTASQAPSIRLGSTLPPIMPLERTPSTEAAGKARMNIANII
jgi:hypothetical protein